MAILTDPNRSNLGVFKTHSGYGTPWGVPYADQKKSTLQYALDRESAVQIGADILENLEGHLEGHLGGHLGGHLEGHLGVRVFVGSVFGGGGGGQNLPKSGFQFCIGEPAPK